MTLHEMTLFENRPLPCISLTFRKMRKNNKLDCWYKRKRGKPYGLPS